MSAIRDPFVDPLPAEIPLERAPLVRVLSQIRYPEVLAIEQADFVASFQQAIRDRYPVLGREQVAGVIIGPNGVVTEKPHVVYRFQDEHEQWRVSLAPKFLALETTRYTSRADFLSRLREITTALNEHISPKFVDRLGVRYIDRISGKDLNEISTLVCPEVRGINGTQIGQHAVHSISESSFSVDGYQCVAKWGTLPAGATVDPMTLEPLNEPSWILDLDMFHLKRMPLDVDQLLRDAAQFTERIYAVFRWAVTDEFLVRYGGKV